MEGCDHIGERIVQQDEVGGLARHLGGEEGGREGRRARV